MKASNVVTFIFGAAVGSAATWYFAKKRYELIVQEELKSIKDAFDCKDEVSEEDDEEEEEESGSLADVASQATDSFTSYSNILTNLGYMNTNTKITDVKKAPYVITPDDFGEIDDYTQISFTYYSDKVLADDNDEIVKNIDDIVGIESLNHFGQYEDDSVFVRNDRLKCDYEILLDSRAYSEVLAEKPYIREVL